MEAPAGTDPPILRNRANSSGVHKRGSFKRHLSQRVSLAWVGFMRNINNQLDRQKMKEWAANNACTLIFMSAMFIITWILLFV